ncbi:DNA-binding transcriptional regulator, XRE family [Saccharopolyspora antimicrobica]|uniref:DNA-binding Xre family transcriptional regulator n=1 Tax=Saccharopolyspora antimicrobica TaxID=455193 RepID=A0A1I5AVN5_9PSEU|nr:helix-turn-helix transcriptional regulator [Saccharopolyspora antimicrobica]RKT86380.1 DNA-binding Xre family transcriptional regulator [Saccharopolyspora antimicrobica]SFN66450.1 DNA-binding transcriptional regulator, XRE family [Saccharopolyspora antimicrobica]
MYWNLRLVAARRGIFTKGELQRLLTERGYELSDATTSRLWSHQPHSVKLSELDGFCTVLGCGVNELLSRKPATIPVPGDAAPASSRARGGDQ